VIWSWGERSLARNTFWWFWTNTGIPFSFGTAVLLGLFVGIAISGQTFYSFVLENLKYFAAIKAMGAGMGVIARMLFVQAFTAGLIGFGLGAGMAQAAQQSRHHAGHEFFFGVGQGAHASHSRKNPSKPSTLRATLA
jgi:hypothetical protein